MCALTVAMSFRVFREHTPACYDLSNWQCGQEQCHKSVVAQVFCFCVLSALGAEAEAEESGRIAKGLAALLPQWGILVLWVIVTFPSFHTVFGKEEDPAMIHRHMEVRENYICMGRNLFGLS